MNQPVPMHDQRPVAAASPRLSRLAQFGNLSGAQKRTLVVAWLWLPVFWIGLRTLNLQRFQSRLQRKPFASARHPPMSQSEVQALAEAVNIAARHTPFHATCLTRSLLLCWLLKRRGVASELRIGVNLASGTLQAHAWVECAGSPVNDRADIADEFKPFASQPMMTAFSAS
jgi:hypothetical protein